MSQQVFQKVSENESIDNVNWKKRFGSQIEYYGIINKNGRLASLTGIEDILSKPKRDMLFMHIALLTSMQRELDEELGSVKYFLIQRKLWQFILVPYLENSTLVLVTKSNENPKQILKKIFSLEPQQNVEMKAL